MDLEMFKERFANKFKELSFESGVPDISGLNPKDEHYGEQLEILSFSSVVYKNAKCSFKKSETTAVGYITDVYSEDNDSIIIATRYWNKYGQMTVQKGQATAGWNRRIQNHGIVFNFEIKFTDEEYDNKISMYCKALHNGEVADIIIHVTDEEYQIERDNGVSGCSVAWGLGTYEKMSEEGNISQMMKQFIANVFKRITDCTQEVIEDLWYEE